MELKVYAVRDQKSASFAPPFFNHSHGEAERNFVRVCRDPQSMIAQFPEDYDLYHLGSYDTNTGKITALDTPQHMAKAIDQRAQ